MEDQNSNTCNKRKEIKDDIDEDPTVLKKARYSWQVKNPGIGTSKVTDKGTSVIQNLDDLTLTLVNSNSENLKIDDKTDTNKECSELALDENKTSNQIPVDIDKETLHKQLYKQNPGTLDDCQKDIDDPVPSTSGLQFSELGNPITSPSDSCKDNSTKCDKKDLSVYLNELENENLHKTSVYPSLLDTNVASSGSSGQRSDDVLNSSDSEAEEEGLLFSSPQRCTNSLDFDLHLARWQNQHAAKAIVDNAINKTLEEMGVSPGEDLDEFAADKYYVEDEGIAEAIRRQGLVRQPEDQGSYIHQDNSYSSIEEQSSVVEFNYSEEDVTQPETERSSSVLSDSEPSNHTKPHEVQSELHQNLTIPQNMNLSQHCSDEDFYVKRCSGSESFPADSYHSDLCIPVSSSELIDQAVTMAICSQGLALQNNVL